MKTQVTLAQAIGFAITLVGAVIMWYSTSNSRISVAEEQLKRHENTLNAHEAQISTQQNDMKDIKADLKLIIYKVDELKK